MKLRKVIYQPVWVGQSEDHRSGALTAGGTMVIPGPQWGDESVVTTPPANGAPQFTLTVDHASAGTLEPVTPGNPSVLMWKLTIGATPLTATLHVSTNGDAHNIDVTKLVGTSATVTYSATDATNGVITLTEVSAGDTDFVISIDNTVVHVTAQLAADHVIPIVVASLTPATDKHQVGVPSSSQNAKEIWQFVVDGNTHSMTLTVTGLAASAVTVANMHDTGGFNPTLVVVDASTLRIDLTTVAGTLGNSYFDLYAGDYVLDISLQGKTSV